MIKVGLVVYPGCMISGLFAFAELLEAANIRSGYRHFETLFVGTDLNAVPVTIGNKEVVVSISPVTTILNDSLNAILLPGFWTNGVLELESILRDHSDLQLALKQLLPEVNVWAYCTSVCLLAESGRLEQQKATGTWWLADYLQKKHPQVSWSFVQPCIFQEGNSTASGVNGYLPIVQKLIAEYCGQEILRDIINLMVLPKPDNSSQPFQFIELMQLDDKLMQKIYIWVEATSAQKLSIKAMATALNITERTVSRKVKRLTNLSCAQFMRLIKVHQASEYLIYGAESVSSIGSRLGFSDDAAFRRTFKNVLSYTPSEYRQTFKR